MPAAISITCLDYTAAELRREAKRTDDADAARRMLALALVLEGKSRGERREGAKPLSLFGAGFPHPYWPHHFWRCGNRCGKRGWNFRKIRGSCEGITYAVSGGQALGLGASKGQHYPRGRRVYGSDPRGASVPGVLFGSF
jgi:hypothetical protein